MTAEEHKLRTERFARIRLIKKLLRPLPRRATIHKYPVLKWFAKTARQKSYLWSFRIPEVVPALYAGWILTLLPVYGLQFLLGFLLALGLRANLMILIALQLVSNPVTIWILYPTAFHIGDFFISLFITPNDIDPATAEAFVKGEVRLTGSTFLYWFKATSIGAIIIGYFAAFISSFIYQFMAKRASRSYSLLVEKSKKFAEEKKSRAQEKQSKSRSRSNPVHKKRII